MLRGAEKELELESIKTWFWGSSNADKFESESIDYDPRLKIHTAQNWELACLQLNAPDACHHVVP